MNKKILDLQKTELDEKSKIVGRDVMSHGSYIWCSSFSFIHC